MRHKKDIGRIITILTSFVIVMMLASSSVYAKAAFSVSDEIDDICVYNRNTGELDECNVSVSYLDIVKIVREQNDDGNNLTLMLIISGSIRNADNVYYKIWYNNSYNKYEMVYSNNEFSGGARYIEDDEFTYEITDTFVTTNTIQGTFPLLNSTYPKEEIEGVAYEIDEGSKWIDIVPNVKKGINPEPINHTLDGNNENGNTSNGSDTPSIGFFGLVLVTVCFLAVFRKRLFNNR